MSIYHKHHIIPRHMGGSDDPSNLIELTIEEHAEAHRKLYEQHGCWQDKIAWKMLSGQITVAEATKETQRNYMRNRIISDETLRKMSEGQKRRCANGKHPMQGKKFSLESRKKMSESHKGQTPPNKGKKCSPESIEKNRIGNLNRKKYDCPLCGKNISGYGNLMQHINGKKHKRDLVMVSGDIINQ